LSRSAYNVIRKQERARPTEKGKKPQVFKGQGLLERISQEDASFRREEAKQQFMMRRDGQKEEAESI
jgi:hypothetical protein